MNNVFSLQRFWRLFRKTIWEKQAQLIGFTGLVLVIIFLFYFIFHLPVGKWSGTQRIAFFAGLTGGGTILASFVFNYFSTNASGCSYLTLPASHFEKWLCAVLITGILFPGIFLAFYRVMDMSFVNYYHSHLDIAKPGYKELYDAVHIFSFDNPIANNVIVLFINFAGVALVGSLYFNKNNFIKTALAFCGLLVFVYGVNFIIAKLLFGNITDAFPFVLVEVPLAQTANDLAPVSQAMTIKASIPVFSPETESLMFSPQTRKLFSNMFQYVFPAILWLLAYIRLRDKEF